MPDNKRNYLLLASLIMIWGSSFLLTDRSLLFFTPEQVVTYRLTIGALSMLVISIIYSKRLLVSIRTWFHFSIYAVIGNILPYLLISVGQTSITSGMAGLLMAVMPLVTIVLAHFFLPDDKLNIFKSSNFRDFKKTKISQQDKDALQVLELNNEVKWEQIHSKFKELVKKYHPDKNQGNKKFEDKLKMITLAYSQLKKTLGKK